MKYQALLSEALGSFFLFATVVGSGIMAERLSAGNVAIALLCNALATGAILFVLITMLGPVSGAHFNPAVTLVMRLRRAIGTGMATAYVVAQIVGGILGVWAVHLMFSVPVFQFSERVRGGFGQLTGEGIATFGLLLTIIGTDKFRPNCISASVALYIIGAYWFTSSTSFANPAITIARSLSNSFAGIDPASVPAFMAAQFAGAIAAHFVGEVIFANSSPDKQ